MMQVIERVKRRLSSPVLMDDVFRAVGIATLTTTVAMDRTNLGLSVVCLHIATFL